MRSFYAFKGFDKDLKCRDFQYEVGKTYKMDCEPSLCEEGFHCCFKLQDVFDYYPLFEEIGNKQVLSQNRYCIVKVLGDIDNDCFLGIDRSIKIITNKIAIVQELTIENMLKICNDDLDDLKDSQRAIKTTLNFLQNIHFTNKEEDE